MSTPAADMSLEFLLIAALCLGGVEGVYRKTVDYMRTRKQQGRSLYETHQVVRNELSEMQMKIDMLRGALFFALEKFNSGLDTNPEAAACKYFGTKIFENIASRCIELFGGNGVIMDNDIGRYFCDAKVLGPAGGAVNIIREIATGYIQ